MPCDRTVFGHQSSDGTLTVQSAPAVRDIPATSEHALGDLQEWHPSLMAASTRHSNRVSKGVAHCGEPPPDVELERGNCGVDGGKGNQLVDIGATVSEDTSALVLPIFVLCRNDLPSLRLCWRAIRRRTRFPYRIVMVYNASHDRRLLRYLDKLDGLYASAVVRNSNNMWVLGLDLGNIETRARHQSLYRPNYFCCRTPPDFHARRVSWRCHGSQGGAGMRSRMRYLVRSLPRGFNRVQSARHL